MSTHLKQLDGIRGAAIAAVLLYHFRGYLPAPVGISSSAAKAVAAVGWCGVDLFFVLSGFLITGILLETRAASNYFLSFYARRVFRIFPVYYLTLLMLFFGPSLIHRIVPVTAAPFYFLYVSNWTPVNAQLAAPTLTHFWSLAVEEQFYLVWPLVVRVAARDRLHSIVIYGLTGVPAMRCLLVYYGASYEAIYRNTLCRSDSLLAGALCALLVRYSPSIALRLGRWGLAPLPVAAVLLATCRGSFNNALVATIGFSVIAVASAGILLRALSSRASLLRMGPLVLLGKWSYGIYLFHIPVRAFLGDHFPQHRAWPVAVAGICASVAIAGVSYELVEKRVLRLKSRVEPVYKEQRLCQRSPGRAALQA